MFNFLHFLYRLIPIICILLICRQLYASPIIDAQEIPHAIRVVMDNNYPPYAFLDSKGRAQGILVDQWRLWEGKTGIRVELYLMEWSEAQRRMEADEYDVIDTLFKTEKRMLLYDFSPPYQKIEVPIFFHKEVSGITDVESLREFPVAAVTGDASVDLLKNNGVTHLLLFNNYESMIRSAKKRKVNVFVADKPPALYFLHKLGIRDQFMCSVPLSVGAFHRAVKKGNTALLQTLQKGFSAITPAEYKAIDKKWFGSAFGEGHFLLYLKYLATFGGLIVAVLTFWNWVLRRAVNRRTIALQISEERFQSIFNSVNDAIFIHDKQNGTILNVNQKMIEMYGYSREEAFSLSVEDLSSGLPPYTQVEAMQLMAKAAAGEPQLFDWNARHKDGHLFWVEINVRVASVGADKFILSTVRDVSDRKYSEKMLKESQEQLCMILNSTSEGIYGIDREGKCIFCNSSALRMLGYEVENELLGKNLHEVVYHTRADGILYPECECANNRVLNSCDRIHSTQELLWRKDGNSFMTEFWTYPMLKENEVVGAVVTFIDITARVKLEKQLRQAQKLEAIGRLAGGIAHDFNNKLTVIIGYAQLLPLRKLQARELDFGLEQIMKAALHSREITRQLLAFSRQEVITPQRVDLNVLVNDACTGLGRLIGEDIRIDFKPTHDLWPVKLDPTQFDQIIMNLSVNARDAMPNGGVLSIETNNVYIDRLYCFEHPELLTGDYVQLTVSDTGCGMTKEVKDHIFEPFYTTKEVGKGTGLGLATIYGIIHQNGGGVNVYSEVGIGTVFRIYFPRISDEGGDDVHIPEPLEKGYGTILLVEDDEPVRKITASMLQLMGYDIIMMPGPAEAISFCSNSYEKIDMILTDVIMPGMSGKEMVDRLSVIRPGIPILYMSGYTSDMMALKGVVDNGVHLIQKPFETNTLQRKIFSVIGH